VKQANNVKKYIKKEKKLKSIEKTHIRTNVFGQDA
jgi:hypothetical protein